MLRKLSIFLIALFTLSVSTHPVLAEGYLKYQSAPDLKQSFMELGDVYAPAFTRTIDLYSTIGHQTLSYGEKMFELLDLSGRSILDAHNHVIGKTGEAIGGVVAGVTGEVDALNSKLIKGAKNIEKSKTFVTQDRRGTASIGTVWNSFIDTISNPLVPIFYQAPSTASAGNKNRTNPQTLIVSNPSPSNHSEAVANVIERITAPGVTRAELASSLNALRLELLALNASTRSFASEAAAHASGNSSYSVYQAVSTSGSSNSVSSQWTTSGADISYSLGSVGIGTTTPGATLAVEGSGLFNGDVTANAFYGDGSHLTGIVGSQWGTSGSDLYYTSGNIGIGTNSPASPLHISNIGNDLLTIQSTFGGGGNTANINFQTYETMGGGLHPTASISAIDDNQYSSALAFLTKDPGVEDNSLIERMRIDSNGNVGIGTASPGYKLDVAGLAKFVDSNNNGFSFDTDYPGQNSSYLSVYYPGGSRAVLRSDSTKNQILGSTSFDSAVGIGTTTPGSTLSIGDTNGINFNAGSSATSTFGGNVSINGNINLNGQLLQNNAPFVGSQWTTSGSDISYTTGNVGIGTTNPTAKFQVSNQGLSESTFYTGGVVTGMKLQSQTTNSRTMFGIVPNGTNNLADMWVFNTSDTTVNYGALAWGYEAGSGAWGINSIAGGTQTAKSIYFNATNGQSASTSNLFLATTGNVGIGTTTPWGQLSVNPNALGSGVPEFVVGSSTATHFVVDGAGNVGIGMTAPNSSYRLDINGDARANSYITNAPNNRVNVGDSNSVGVYAVAIGSYNSAPGYNVAIGWWNHAAGSYSNIVGYNNTSSGYLTSAYGFGNVSTGATSTTMGTNNTASGFESLAYGIYNNVSASGASAFGQYITNSVASSTMIGPNDSSKITILNGGYLGIGTTTPWAKLAVNGQAVADYFTAVSTSATSTFAGGFSANGGAIVSDFSTGVTSISNLSFGAQSFDADSGMLSWIDMPVTSSASAGTVESYTAQIDGNPLLTIYSESDGAGGIQNQRIGIGTSSPYLGPLTMASGAYVTTGGTWTNASDRNLKENFTEIDDQDILNKISSLPITRWNYKTEATSTMHIGPMAQDFFATFGLGGSDKSISTIDPAGIALSAIKALNLNLNAIASSTASTTPASLSFASGFFSTVYSHISTWLASATNGIANIFSNKVTTNELCVGSTCVTETQLKALLEKAGQPVTTYGPKDSDSTSSTTADTQTSTTTPADSSDSSTVDTSTSASTTSPDTSGGDTGTQSDTPAVEVAPDSTPAPDPAPAPTPDPAPAPAPAP